MTSYVRRPVVVEGRQLTPFNAELVRSWLLAGENPPETVLVCTAGRLMIITKDSEIGVPVNHHVLRHRGGKIEVLSQDDLNGDYDKAATLRVPVATTEDAGLITGFYPDAKSALAACEPGEIPGNTHIALEHDEFFGVPDRRLVTKDFGYAFGAAAAAGSEVIIRCAGKERPLLQTRGRS